MLKWEYGGTAGSRCLSIDCFRLWVYRDGSPKTFKAKLGCQRGSLAKDFEIKEWALKTDTIEAAQAEALLLLQIWLIELLKKGLSVR